MPMTLKSPRKRRTIGAKSDMSRTLLHLTAVLLTALLSGCALTKVVTVPVKATATVVGGTADIID
jgi:hypothetical protein